MTTSMPGSCLRRWVRRALAAARVAPLALLAPLAPLACSEAPGGAPTGAGIRVVCTTGMIADAAAAIGAGRARVDALMGPGVDPHQYKPSPSDLRALQTADLVLYNGLHLEGKMTEALDRLAARGSARAVADAVPPDRLRSPPEFEGQADPHVWFDVALWSHACGAVRDALIRADPAGRPVYEANAARYLADLADLDAWCREQIARIPPQRRLLVTAHDAFGYFGRAYGIEVMGIQGISTDSESSIRDINRLVDVLVARGVPAVFVESSVPRKTIDALAEGCAARGHRVAIGGEIFSDAMGDADTPEGTYQGMVRHNVRTIVAALADGAEAKP